MKKVLYIMMALILGIILYYVFPEQELPTNTVIDKMVVYKSKRELLAYSKGKVIKTYKVAIGQEPIGAKEYEGDKKTPEGLYYINDKNPNSGYHKNLGISYPNANDIVSANRLKKPAGGNIKIHGLLNHYGFVGKFHRWHDWTLGCIALTDEEIDELYGAVKIGTPIEIIP